VPRGDARRTRCASSLSSYSRCRSPGISTSSKLLGHRATRGKLLDGRSPVGAELCMLRCFLAMSRAHVASPFNRVTTPYTACHMQRHGAPHRTNSLCTRAAERPFIWHMVPSRFLICHPLLPPSLERKPYLNFCHGDWPYGREHKRGIYVYSQNMEKKLTKENNKQCNLRASVRPQLKRHIGSMNKNISIYGKMTG